MQVRADDFQGASIEDMLGRLLDEHAEQALRVRLRADAAHARSNDEDLDEVRLVLEELDELSAW